MMSRLLPSASIIVALTAVAVVLATTVGASGDGAKGAQREDGAGTSSAVCAPGHPDCDDMIVEPGGDVANACIEGTVDCNDTIDLPVDGGSNEPIEKPDEPVSSEPGVSEPGSAGGDVPNSGDLVPPDECNLVHNIDACSSPGYDPGAN